MRTSLGNELSNYKEKGGSIKEKPVKPG